VIVPRASSWLHRAWVSSRPESPDDFVLRVTKRIAERRRELGVTQDELAEGLGTATRNVQRMEAGQNLTLHTLARIAAVLGVSPDLFVHDPARRRYPVAPPPEVHVLSEGRTSFAKKHAPGAKIEPQPSKESSRSARKRTER
jgi:transcriptional regulator with XRE-family HTH domain